ncbi:RluA family pseudouridine synthase [Candidimonas nitroreducens]|uniref:Pseudouridine synthase n=1 Tax=Candidimonas nitroreducens TaxID=683354 RepID=A0A225M454_9BURK|nr:RluA family pseudouridine synthase [Candidimonas nitroreducens]OWT56105.1 RNA pseudouridine synthase [Candidimonas nitroreducens]
MPDTALPTESPAAGEPVEFELPLKALPDRLDKVLAGLMPEHSRSRLQGWIEAGYVLVNGQAARVRQAVGAGDKISVRMQPTPESLAFCAEPVDFRVIAESPDWIVVDKPAGLVTHPGAGNWHGTLLNGLLHRYPELRQVARAGIVHRLDKDTSGLLVVARHERAQTDLVRQLQARTVKREYLALAHGLLQRAVTVARDIGRDPRVPVRMTVERPIAPKPAVTHCEPRRRGADAQGQPVTLAACRLETGRTHQIRVHLASLGHPLVGDLVYGGRFIAGARRHMLHARALGFDDAASGRRVSFEAEPPADFCVVLDNISWQA